MVAPEPAVAPPEPEARPQASDLASLPLTGANEERAERSSPAVLAAPQDSFEEVAQDQGDAGDTQPDSADPFDADATLAKTRAAHSAR